MTMGMVMAMVIVMMMAVVMTMVMMRGRQKTIRLPSYARRTRAAASTSAATSDAVSAVVNVGGVDDVKLEEVKESEPNAKLAPPLAVALALEEGTAPASRATALAVAIALEVAAVALAEEPPVAADADPLVAELKLEEAALAPNAEELELADGLAGGGNGGGGGVQTPGPEPAAGVVAPGRHARHILQM